MEPPSPDTIRVAARLHLRVAQADELVDWAAAERIAGRGGRYLERLADLESFLDLGSAIAYFERALGETGYSLPPVEEGLRAYARQLAEGILLGAIDPLQACGLLCRIWISLGQPTDLEPWGLLDDSLALDGQTPISSDEALELIRAQAERLVAGIA